MRALSLFSVSALALLALGCGDMKSRLSNLDSLVLNKEKAPARPPAAAPVSPEPSPAPSAHSARALEGVYDVQGTNPGGSGNYRGTAMISRQGEAYRIDWSVGTSYTGTGVLRGDSLSVEWGDGTAAVGTVKYNIEPDGRLTGVWYTHNNPNSLGSEILIPRR